jgi:hypothetical protein
MFSSFGAALGPTGDLCLERGAAAGLMPLNLPIDYEGCFDLSLDKHLTYCSRPVRVFNELKSSSLMMSFRTRLNFFITKA